jgi:hypothetical protein
VPGYLLLSDTPSDQVLCTVQISEVKVHIFVTDFGLKFDFCWRRRIHRILC